jgi:hypothetical protein
LGLQQQSGAVASVIGVCLVGLVLTLLIQRLRGRELRASQMEGM